MLTWLFDYDLTLYGVEERCVIQSLDDRISLSVQNAVGGDLENAHRIRKEYLAEFGTTLAGLQAMHGVKPDDFFDFIHQPEFLIYPKASPEKRALLQSLPGRHFVFTNGRHDWSEAGMDHMGIRDCFEGVFDLKLMDWIGKPHESAYEKMVQFLGERDALPENPKEIILLEDSLRNLEPAHKMGWTTVWVNPDGETPDWVDLHIPHLLNLRDKLAFSLARS